jgi:hypothetical protein
MHYICKFTPTVVNRHLGFGLGMSLEDLTPYSTNEYISINQTKMFRTIFRGQELWYQVVDGFAVTQGDIILGPSTFLSFSLLSSSFSINTSSNNRKRN